MKFNHSFQHAVRWLLVPTSLPGCYAGMLVVVAVGLSLLQLHPYVPDVVDTFLAVGIPSLGGAGLLYYWWRSILLGY